MISKKLSEAYNNGDPFTRFQNLPKRIFLDSNVLQYLNDFGKYIFDHYRESGDYFLSSNGRKISKENRLYNEIVALGKIFLGIDRANFEFAVSKSVLKEVLRKKDGSYTQWFFDIWQHWQSIVKSYNGSAFSRRATMNLSKINGDKSIVQGISKEDRLILFDALRFDCNVILTVDRYRNRQNEIYDKYKTMILYPTDFIEILEPFRALYL